MNKVGHTYTLISAGIHIIDYVTYNIYGSGMWVTNLFKSSEHKLIPMLFTLSLVPKLLIAV